MSIAGHFQAHGLSVNVADPLVWAYRDRADYGNYAPFLSSYRHTIAANGGFDSARISLKGNRTDIESWLERGIGRHIEVNNAALDRVWEGFVNTVSISVGPLTVTRGPLNKVGNKIDLIYSSIDTTADPPAVGARERLSDPSNNAAYVQDTLSQAEYGIWTRVLSTGGMRGVAEALDVVNTYLADNKEPQTSQRFGAGGGVATVSLECLGYGAWLDYPYNLATTGAVNLSAKITAVLGADPNGIISTDYNNVATNTIQVSQYEDEDRKAMAILLGLVAHGDANALRYTAGLYENRKMYYTAMPTDVAYEQALADPRQRIATEAGAEVFPWDVRPAQWLFYTDFLTGRTTPATLADRRTDARYEFIEKVSYTAPWGLAHEGLKQGTLKQVLSKYGLTGVGA